MTGLELIGAFVGLPAAMIGVAGGWLTLVKQFKEWQISNRPHGKRAVTSLVMAREDSPTYTDIQFLFVGDVMKWLRPLSALGGKLTHFSMVGEYYHVTMRFPPGQQLELEIIKHK